MSRLQAMPARPPARQAMYILEAALPGRGKAAVAVARHAPQHQAGDLRRAAGQQGQWMQGMVPQCVRGVLSSALRWAAQPRRRPPAPGCHAATGGRVRQEARSSCMSASLSAGCTLGACALTSYAGTPRMEQQQKPLRHCTHLFNALALARVLARASSCCVRAGGQPCMSAGSSWSIHDTHAPSPP